MTDRKNYQYPYPYAADLRIPVSEVRLEGVEHGTMRGVRAGCNCSECMARKKRAMKRGWRL